MIPLPGAAGDVESLALHAGTGSAAIHAVLPAADIVAELAGPLGAGRRAEGTG